ncbi:sulfate ABC transporter permease subunit CysT [Paracoccus albus]|uniref:sulfate ABC transporter permease subunit CysT n=1 Tax=Paracoccus albus TaxID=3017784 RepID=UPI0022F06F90|nr:sulfate ABC transporter permease subunit CysT [Paracoccus albus]WBU59500.1 sulfate ABC transporter permease subunit CysT [Paracoccus albus]
MASIARREPRILPGFSLSMGITLLFLCLIVLLPISGLLWQLAQLGPGDYVRVMGSERVLTALRVTITAAAVATALNGVFGVIIAWVLTRYRFPGRGIADALVDLPFALPTAVAGIALVALYDKSGWLGGLLDSMGLQVAYTWWGIVIAMTFTSIPFAVRAIQPAIEELDRDEESAALTLGASRPQLFLHVFLRPMLPSILTGVGLSFVRSLGEFGAVIFIAGNMPYETEIASLLILIRLDEFDYPAAAAIAGTLLGLSLVLLVLINFMQNRLQSYLRTEV